MSSAIWCAECVRVPLNSICSMQWLMPRNAGLSCDEPTPTHRPMLALRTCGSFSVMTRSPLGSVDFV